MKTFDLSCRESAYSPRIPQTSPACVSLRRHYFVLGVPKTLKAIPPSLAKVVHQTAAGTSCRCALQRRDKWAAKLSPIAVTPPDKQRQQFFDLTQLRHPLTHNCQLVAGDLLHFAAMPAVL